MNSKKCKQRGQGRPGSGLVLLVLVVGILVMGTGDAEAQLPCVTITSWLRSDCFGYLTNGGAVPIRCCKSVRRVLAASRTRAARQATCRCLEKESRVPRNHVRAAYARRLPILCNVASSVPPTLVSPSTDCSKIP